jgi:hypothetical protein
MKRCLIFITLSLILCSAVFSAPLTITLPPWGEFVLKGGSQRITWTADAPPPGTMIKLILLSNGTPLGDIVTNVPVTPGVWTWANAGSYIGSSAIIGAGYSIRISTMDNLHTADSAPFILFTGKVLSPAAHETWLIGGGGIPMHKFGGKKISWQIDNLPANTQIDIALYTDHIIGYLVKNIPLGPGGSGSWNWNQVGTHSEGKAAPGVYSILISHVGRKWAVNSSPFRLAQPEVLPK